VELDGAYFGNLYVRADVRSVYAVSNVFIYVHCLT
jgi:hypothetical protein